MVKLADHDEKLSDNLLTWKFFSGGAVISLAVKADSTHEVDRRY